MQEGTSDWNNSHKTQDRKLSIKVQGMETGQEKFTTEQCPKCGQEIE